MKHICLLRGINVSGQKIIKMEQLRKLFESLGFESVQSYIQSGNIVFETKESETKLEEKIARAIEKSFGFSVSVIVRNPELLRKVIEDNPFKDKELKRLYVTFLSAKPDKNLIDELFSQDFGEEKLILKDQVIYFYCPIGYGKTKLSNHFLENKLKVTATTRNWNTLNKLYKLAP